MSIISNAVGVNIDLTKDVENLAVDAGRQAFAKELQDHGLPTNTLGMCQYFTKLGIERVVAKYDNPVGHDIAAILQDLYNYLEPSIPNIEL